MDSFHRFGQILLSRFVGIKLLLLTPLLLLRLLPMGIPSDPGDFPLYSAFKAFLTSSSNIVASSSQSFVSYIVVRLSSRLYKFSV